MERAADRAVADVVRTSYGRLVALVAVRTHDLAAAEDALSEALLAALRTWPAHGIPDSPEAWMLTAARRSLIGAHRRSETARRAAPTLALLQDELAAAPASSLPDRRLELLFACAHPALAADVRAPLMLQTVLGLDAARIASAFLVKPATLGQQLSRAKRRIADAGIPYRVPDADELPERLGFVLDAIYAAYGTGWDDPAGLDPRRGDLTGEAIHLATTVAELLPAEAEAHGLAALLLHSDARAAARRAEDGRFIPLAEQDVSRWSRDRMDHAERHLAQALALGVIGPYQLQAAIQSVHNRRTVTNATDWVAISALHDGLHRLAPSTGAGVARAAAHLHADGPDAAATILDELEPDAVADYQPYWVVRAEIALARGDGDAATTAMGRAIRLTVDPATTAHLRRRLADGASPPRTGSGSGR
jgi:RNA polymerase sigma-70 factor (ECF subfamily)